MPWTELQRASVATLAVRRDERLRAIAGLFAAGVGGPTSNRLRVGGDGSAQVGDNNRAQVFTQLLDGIDSSD